MTPSAHLVSEIQTLVGDLARARDEIARRVIGQREVVEQLLAAILTGGHALLVGPPGLGKTMLAETVSHVLGLGSARVQFTPDLMPSDILGAEVLDTDPDGRRQFRLVKGPIFTQLLLADEINRASPRTQSALLQAMQERAVTLAGMHYDLGAPFHVLATQNPLDQEGTYPLPEAQLDRFAMQIALDFPDRDAEADIIRAAALGAADAPEAIFDAARLIAAQELVRQVPLGESVMTAILDLVRAARPGTEAAPAWVSEALIWGPGPRAAQALALAVRARAVLQGRYAPDHDDVLALAAPVLRHRVGLGYALAAEGQSADDVINRLCAALNAGALHGESQANGTRHNK